jgi:hypothetical protein
MRVSYCGHIYCFVLLVKVCQWLNQMFVLWQSVWLTICCGAIFCWNYYLKTLTGGGREHLLKGKALYN